MSAEDRLRYEINKCRRCEACKELLHISCVVFPEMFRLVDAACEIGEEITSDQLRHLASLCNFCAACPCSEIRTAMIDAKTEYAEKYGLGFNIRAIENMDRIGRLGGAIPHLSNFLLRNRMTRSLIAQTMGIHRDRKIPYFAAENFPEWFRTKKQRIQPRPKIKGKVAYFSGCTANYFFPEVAGAVVEVFARNGIEVFYPEQKCCGMPPLLEGDRNLTLEFARFNVEHLAKAVEEGCDIVCSCPTCGYMLKKILRAGADQAYGVLIWKR